jgi:hypothetical protein
MEIGGGLGKVAEQAPNGPETRSGGRTEACEACGGRRAAFDLMPVSGALRAVG